MNQSELEMQRQIAKLERHLEITLKIRNLPLRIEDFSGRDRDIYELGQLDMKMQVMDAIRLPK